MQNFPVTMFHTLHCQVFFFFIFQVLHDSLRNEKNLHSFAVQYENFQGIYCHQINKDPRGFQIHDTTAFAEFQFALGQWYDPNDKPFSFYGDCNFYGLLPVNKQVCCISINHEHHSQ